MQDIKKILNDNGWYEGRSVDITEFEEYFKSMDLKFHDPARKMLMEFGYLVISVCSTITTSSGDIINDKFEIRINPIKVDMEDYIIKSYSIHFKDSLILVAEKNNFLWDIYLGESGCYYACGGSDGLCLELYTFYDVLDYLINYKKIDRQYEFVNILDDDD